MPKIALVLSGGGALGAFQAAAAKYAHEQKGYEWDLIRGVSAGALNAAFIAQGKYTELDALWHSITRKDVYTGSLFWGLAWRVLILGKRSIYDLTPLRRLIDRHVDPNAIVTPVRVGVTSLFSGEYATFGKGGAFKRATLASATLPVLWEPVDGLPNAADAVDGGVRNISPLKDVISEDPDQIVIINCSPRDKSPVEPGRPGDILQVALRTLSITMDEIFISDVNQCLSINDLVRQARKQNAVLRDEHGKVYKEYDVKVIEPIDPLGDPLDFTRKAMDAFWEAGLQRAKDVLG